MTSAIYVFSRMTSALLLALLCNSVFAQGARLIPLATMKTDIATTAELAALSTHDGRSLQQFDNFPGLANLPGIERLNLPGFVGLGSQPPPVSSGNPSPATSSSQQGDVTSASSGLAAPPTLPTADQLLQQILKSQANSQAVADAAPKGDTSTLIKSVNGAATPSSSKVPPIDAVSSVVAKCDSSGSSSCNASGVQNGPGSLFVVGKPVPSSASPSTASTATSSAIPDVQAVAAADASQFQKQIESAIASSSNSGTLAGTGSVASGSAATANAVAKAIESISAAAAATSSG